MAERQKAFTLIEFVIYGALVTIIVGALVLTSVNVLTGRAKITAIEEVNHNARFALERVMHEIRRAEAITLPLPGSFASSLNLVDADGDVREGYLRALALFEIVNDKHARRYIASAHRLVPGIGKSAHEAARNGIMLFLENKKIVRAYPQFHA